MKKRFAAAILIAACVALCAAVWPQSGAGGKMPAGADSGEFGINVDGLAQPTSESIIALSDDTPVVLTAEHAAPEPVEVIAEKEEFPDKPLPTEAPSPGMQETPAATPAPQNSAPASTDPYHTDVYPNNIYSEELVYDANGNLIGKTVTYPTAFGPDTIWIDGHAYYDIPGFGLVEWSGPSQRTEDYTMYESGVKIGIMGGEDEAPASSALANQPTGSPDSAGEVIDQTIITIPEKRSTPPDDKP